MLEHARALAKVPPSTFKFQTRSRRGLSAVVELSTEVLTWLQDACRSPSFVEAAGAVLAEDVANAKRRRIGDVHLFVSVRS